MLLFCFGQMIRYFNERQKQCAIERAAGYSASECKNDESKLNEATNGLRNNRCSK